MAALDLGTNNCRLLVARPSSDGFAVIDSFSRIVRLGEGVARSGRLHERAMARTIAALKICARIMARHRPALVRCVATEACRRARNGAEFIARVARVTGIELAVLSRDEEVRLALLGCWPLIDPKAQHVLLIDIGGGSTEIAWLDRQRPDAAVLRCAVSLPLGVVTLSESFAGEPEAGAYAAMVAAVHDRLAPLEAMYRIRERLRGRRVQLLGTSGTITTLAALLLDLPRYDRRRIDGLELTPAMIAGVTARLQQMDGPGRLAHPCIGPGRADLVLAGGAILEAVLEAWPPTTLRVADRGLREGILHGLTGRTLERVLGLATPPAATPSARLAPAPALPGVCGDCAD